MAHGEATMTASVLRKRTNSYFRMHIATLGECLGRTNDPPPGNLVTWRGLSWLTDILLGIKLRSRRCG